MFTKTIHILLIDNKNKKMITKTYRFHVQTQYVNSRVSEDVVLEFEDDATKEKSATMAASFALCR